MNLMRVFRPKFCEVLKQVLIFKHMNNLISVKWSTSAYSEFKDRHGPKCFSELLSTELGSTRWNTAEQKPNTQH